MNSMCKFTPHKYANWKYTRVKTEPARNTYIHALIMDEQYMHTAIGELYSLYHAAYTIQLVMCI